MNYVLQQQRHTHLVSGQPAADGTGLLGAKVERHVLLVGVVLTELRQRKTHDARVVDDARR